MRPMAFALGLIVLASPALAGDSLSGLWEEVSAPGQQASTVVISQEGTAVFVASYWEHKGQGIVWHGDGDRKGNKITYQIVHTRYPKGWDPRGTHTLTLSADGKTMTGTWKNTRGQSGPLKFVRRK